VSAATQLILFDAEAAAPGRPVRDPAALRPQPDRDGADWPWRAADSRI
jgi:hypothetical protein